MRDARPDATALRSQTERAVTLVALVRAGAVAAAGCLALALVLALLDARAAGARTLRATAVAGLAVVAAATIATAAWWARRRRVGPLARRTLMDAFPGQRRELDAWLDDELVGGDERAVRSLLRKRLERRLPPRAAVLPAQPLPGLRYALVAAIGLLLLFVGLRGLSPWAAFGRIGKGLIERERVAPLSLTALEPADRWFMPRRPARLALEFDRRLAGDGRLRLAGSAVRFPLAPTGGGAAYAVCLPAVTRDCAVVIEGDGLASEPVPLRVFPQDVLRITGAVATPEGGGEPVVSDAESFPLEVDEGSTLRFELAYAPCPVRAMGIAGHATGELPMKRISPTTYAAELEVRRDDVYRLWWEYPDGTRVERAPRRVDCRYPGAPRLEITWPRDGTRVVRFKTIEVKVGCRYAGPPPEVYLMGTDYHGMVFSRAVAIEAADASGGGLGTKAIAIEDFAQPTGRVIGICAATVVRGRQWRVVTSNVVNLLLPKRTSREEAGDRMLTRLSEDSDVRLGSVFEWREQRDMQVFEMLCAASFAEAQRGPPGGRGRPGRGGRPARAGAAGGRGAGRGGARDGRGSGAGRMSGGRAPADSAGGTPGTSGSAFARAAAGPGPGRNNRNLPGGRRGQGEGSGQGVGEGEGEGASGRDGRGEGRPGRRDGNPTRSGTGGGSGGGGEMNGPAGGGGGDMASTDAHRDPVDDIAAARLVRGRKDDAGRVTDPLDESVLQPLHRPSATGEPHGELDMDTEITPEHAPRFVPLPPNVQRRTRRLVSRQATEEERRAEADERATKRREYERVLDIRDRRIVREYDRLIRDIRK